MKITYFALITAIINTLTVYIQTTLQFQLNHKKSFTPKSSLINYIIVNLVILFGIIFLWPTSHINSPLLNSKILIGIGFVSGVITAIVSSQLTQKHRPQNQNLIEVTFSNTLIITFYFLLTEFFQIKPLNTPLLLAALPIGLITGTITQYFNRLTKKPSLFLNVHSTLIISTMILAATVLQSVGGEATLIYPIAIISIFNIVTIFNRLSQATFAIKNNYQKAINTIMLFSGIGLSSNIIINEINLFYISITAIVTILTLQYFKSTQFWKKSPKSIISQTATIIISLLLTLYFSQTSSLNSLNYSLAIWALTIIGTIHLFSCNEQ